MTLEAIVAAFALGVVAAYVCRVDRLTWRRHPLQMLMHAVGGIVAFWVLAAAAQGQAGPVELAALACCVALLVMTYPRVTGINDNPAWQPATIQPDDMRRVSGGTDRK